MGVTDVTGTQAGISQWQGRCRSAFTWLPVFALVIAATPALAGRPVTVEWDRNPEPDIAGYIVSVGSSPGGTILKVDAGTWPSWTFTQLSPGRTYYFRVQAYNTAGQISLPSAEVSATLPGGGRPSVTFEEWARAFGISSSGGDEDGDGVTNEAEYRGGTNPLVSDRVYLAEGATGAFEERIAIVNPGDTPVDASLRFLLAGGGTVDLSRTLAPMSRSTVNVNEVAGLERVAASAEVNTRGGSVAVERTMAWTGVAPRSAAHTAKASSRASSQWFFAEGDTKAFDTWLLLANPNPQAVSVAVDYLTTAGAVITREYLVPASSRFTIYANAVEGLPAGAFSTRVRASRPISAERAMYFGHEGALWRGGHATGGVTEPAKKWFVAEGRTGPFFDTWLLIANPSTSPARVVLSYLTPSGEARRETRTLTANSRTTIHVDALPELLDTDVSVVIDSNTPVVVERAMYWPGNGGTWHEGHVSVGMTVLGTRWALAEGEVGGPNNVESYILLANPSDVPATVILTALREAGRPPQSLTRTVAARSRLTVSLRQFVGLESRERCGVLVESTTAIAVERSMYWSAGGRFWSAGTNETAVRLR